MNVAVRNSTFMSRTLAIRTVATWKADDHILNLAQHQKRDMNVTVQSDPACCTSMFCVEALFPVSENLCKRIFQQKGPVAGKRQRRHGCRLISIDAIIINKI